MHRLTSPVLKERTRIFPLRPLGRKQGRAGERERDIKSRIYQNKYIYISKQTHKLSLYTEKTRGLVARTDP